MTDHCVETILQNLLVFHYQSHDFTVNENNGFAATREIFVKNSHNMGL